MVETRLNLVENKESFSPCNLMSFLITVAPKKIVGLFPQHNKRLDFGSAGNGISSKCALLSYFVLL